MIYIYKCPICGEFEYKQSVLDKSLKVCPTCTSDVYRVVTGGLGTIYKTSGFYSTDNRKE